MCLVVTRTVTVSMGPWFVFSFSQAFWAAVVGQKGSIAKKKVPIVESSWIIEESCPLEKNKRRQCYRRENTANLMTFVFSNNEI